MAIGFTLLNGSTAVPDKNLSLASKPRVLIAKFGDGYEQRISDGINSMEESFSVSFKTRTKEEIDEIKLFLESKKGVGSFDFTYPESNAVGGEITIKVVCDSFNTTFEYDEFYSLTASFRRVYEP
jgi:phage-related protein